MRWIKRVWNGPEYVPIEMPKFEWPKTPVYPSGEHGGPCGYIQKDRYYYPDGTSIPLSYITSGVIELQPKKDKTNG